MFDKFKYETIPLAKVFLDKKNPRIVKQLPLKSEDEIILYLFEYEKLEKFIKQIVSQGKNFGAERPYVVKTGTSYVVVEGNNRIAAYKLLAGIVTPPPKYATAIPKISPLFRKSLIAVECSVAPSRDMLLSVMASSHFGTGDKSKWGYLGSRKVVYDEFKAGRKVTELAAVFNQSEGDIRNLIIEYLLYLASLSLNWSKHEMSVLLNPAVRFNPPVRFLETSGHKDKIGLKYDFLNLKVLFLANESKAKFRHLVKKLVIHPEKNLGATASYEKVFLDYESKQKETKQKGEGASEPNGTKSGATANKEKSKADGSEATSPHKTKPNTLFSYAATVNNGVIKQLMKEVRSLDCLVYPAAGTFLLRNIIEALLKHIIGAQSANPDGKNLSLEDALNICSSNKVKMAAKDKLILKEFQKSHLSHLNLGAHGNVVPNFQRLEMVRDCVDQFIKDNV